MSGRCPWLFCHALGLAMPWALNATCALSLPTLVCSSFLIACSSQRAAGARRLSRKLLQVSILTIDTQDRFNTYNDFASLDFDVQFNVGPLQDPR